MTDLFEQWDAHLAHEATIELACARIRGEEVPDAGQFIRSYVGLRIGRAVLTGEEPPHPSARLISRHIATARARSAAA